MVLTRVLVLLLGAAVVAAAAESPAAVHLANNSAKFKQMLSTVGVDDKAIQAMNGILLVPSDAAVDSFASSMGMTLPQLLSNKLLVDQVTAYHFLPDVRVDKDFKAPSMPLMTKTGEVHYIVRFYKDPKTNRAWLQDMQGNKVTLKQLPVVFGNLTIVPVDKVLMSGGYFKSFEDALKLHAQLSKAGDLLKTAGGQASIAAAGSNATLLLPVDKAFDSSKVTTSSLNQADSRKVLQYHAITPARPADQLQSGTKATLLSGHTVKVDAETSGGLKAPWSGRSVNKPVVTVTDEAGNKADVALFNIWAGKGVIHGINKVLQPKTAATVSTEKAPAQLAVQRPASAGRRHLLQVLHDTLSGWHYQHRTSSNTVSTPRKFINRQLLQSGPASQYSPDWSQQTNPASALLAQNTVGAAYASAQKLKNAFYGTPDSPGWVSGGRWEQWGVI